MTKCVGWYLNFEPSLATRKVHQTYQRSSFLLTDVILGELTDVTVVEYYGWWQHPKVVYCGCNKMWTCKSCRWVPSPFFFSSACESSAQTGIPFGSDKMIQDGQCHSSCRCDNVIPHAAASANWPVSLHHLQGVMELYTKRAPCLEAQRSSAKLSEAWKGMERLDSPSIPYRVFQNISKTSMESKLRSGHWRGLVYNSQHQHATIEPCDPDRFCQRPILRTCLEPLEPRKSIHNICRTHRHSR